MKTTCLSRTWLGYSLSLNIYVVCPKSSRLIQITAHLKQYRRQKRPINRKIIRREPSVDPLEIAIKKDFSNQEANCASSTTDKLTWANTRLYVDANYPTDDSKQAIRDEVSSFLYELNDIGSRVQNRSIKTFIADEFDNSLHPGCVPRPD